MYRKIIGLIGAITALAAPQAARALPAATPSATEVLKVQSYGDLLNPIPDALVLLRAIDAASAPMRVQKAQYYGDHHHHHHNQYGPDGGGYGYGYPPPPPPPHHHHHNGYWGNGY